MCVCVWGGSKEREAHGEVVVVVRGSIVGRNVGGHGTVLGLVVFRSSTSGSNGQAPPPPPVGQTGVYRRLPVLGQSGACGTVCAPLGAARSRVRKSVCANNGEVGLCPQGKP